MTDQDEELPVPAFFENKQAIGLIALIDREHGNITNELADKVAISDRKLTGLLEDAIDADLIEETQMRAGDHPRANRYRLTTRGKAIQSLLRLRGLDDIQRDYIDRKQELEKAKPELQDIIEAEGLHKEPLQRDFWIRTNAESEELDREKLLAELEQREMDRAEQEQPDGERENIRGENTLPPDILNGEEENDADPGGSREKSSGDSDESAEN